VHVTPALNNLTQLNFVDNIAAQRLE